MQCMESRRLSGSAHREDATNPAAAWLTRTQLLSVFCLALAVLAAIVIYDDAESRRESEARTRVAHTLLVMQQAMQLQNAAMLMEVEHRAFLVRNDPALLASRENYRQEADRSLAQLRALTKDNAQQQARLDTVARLFDERVVRIRKTTELLQREGIEVARAHFDPSGQGSIAPLRVAIGELDHAEARLFAIRSDDATAQSRQLRWLLLLGPGLGIVLLGSGLYVLVGQLRRSECISRELVRANDEARHALGLVDATHDGVLIYAADTLRLSYVNQGAVDQVGYSRAELLGMTALDIKRAFDEAGFRYLLKPLLAGEVDVLAFETQHRRKDGVDVPVEVSVRYATLGGGAPSLVTIARDISARKLAEDERDRFFNLSLDMLCIATADGWFKRLSPAFTRTLGWSLEELQARPFLDFVHPDDRAATLAELERQVGVGEPVMHFENRYRHKDGSWRVLSWKSALPTDGRMYATARDVTDSKAAEQRIVELNHELTERQVALESANKELEAFSYSVSHDLRAPLRHIDGYARMLEEDAADQLQPEARRYLQTVIDSARRMGVLIDDLLAFSRLGRKPLASQQIDMQGLVKRAIDELAANTGGGRGMPIAIEATLPSICGDPALLLQVWINLLSNAVKYSAPRGDAAHIVVAGESEGDRIRYSVSDNGVGFDMRYADKLFGVFQRLHAQDEFEGTGVGLAIVQRIVNRHGGRVCATGEPNHGACFSFDLPIGEAIA